MRTTCLLVVLILTATGSLGAGGETVFVPLEDAGSTALRYDGDCVLGNADYTAAVGYYSDFFSGDEAYATLISPVEEGCACPLGVTVQAVHMALYLTGPTLLSARVLLHEAVEIGPGCYAPGGPLATSALYVLEPYVGTALYDLELPLSAPCAIPGDRYFAVFEVVPVTTELGVGVPVDDSPTPCHGYDHLDLNWKDSVVDRGWVGDFYVWADADCCEEPVHARGGTWGSLKTIYR
jgi:hypothetical protein